MKHLSGAVNIMDAIMFEAQRHGRLSFYMVCENVVRRIGAIQRSSLVLT